MALPAPAAAPCEMCGERFWADHTNAARFCSPECWHEFQRRAGRRNSELALALLERGPATTEEVAAALWGPEYLWPDSFRVVVSQVVRRLRDSGRDIDRCYRLTDRQPNISDHIERAMKL